MCELIQSFEKINGNEVNKNCYLVSDVDIMKQFFENTPSDYKSETKDKKTTLIFGNNLKFVINHVLPKDGKKDAYIENESGYMTILFNFYKYLTVKPTKDLPPEYRYQQILLPVEASYQFDNELRRYQKQLEFPTDSNVQNILNLIQKGNIEPQMKLENQDLIIAFQSGLERFNTIIFNDVLLKFKTQNESGFKILFHKAPYIPIFKRDDKKDIRYQVDKKTYNINIHDKTDNMKINLAFQCLNKVDKNSKVPTPINQDEIKNQMQKFALIEAIRIMKQHEQAFHWLNQLEKSSDQKVEQFYKENHPQLNIENRYMIAQLHEISMNDKIGSFKFTDPSFRQIKNQQIKNLAQYVMSQLIQKTELKNQETVLVDLCNDNLHQKQYQCQVQTNFIGRDDCIQTNIVDFVDLINMFTVYYPKNKFMLNVCPQFKFGRRTPTYIIKDLETGEIEKPKIQTMTMETRFIVKQILNEPESLQGDTINYIPGELLELNQIETDEDM